MRLRMGLRIVLATLALGAIAGVLSAQTKIAVINLQRAVLDSAEIKKASADMEAKYKPRTSQIEQLQKEIASISDQLQKGAGKLTPAAESDLTAQGQRKQRDLQRIQEDLQADVDRERNDILGRSGQKMAAIVKKMAEDKGLDLVVDVSNPIAIYYKPTMDLTAEATTDYDKAYPVK